MIIERKIKFVTQQRTIPKDSGMEGFPMREWHVKIYVLDEAGKEKPATCFNKVTYNLHPSFENPNQTFHEPPFTCQNEGWGEFEMSIDIYTTEKAKQTIFHDLNFAATEYENIHTYTFKNPSQALQAILRETGPVSEDKPRKSGAGGGDKGGGARKKSAYDFEKMGDALTKLDEDDLLHVIQMIHDHKTDDTYTKNDMEAGEFSVDLYTLSDSLAKMLWDFLADQKLV